VFAFKGKRVVHHRGRRERQLLVKGKTEKLFTAETQRTQRKTNPCKKRKPSHHRGTEFTEKCFAPPPPSPLPPGEGERRTILPQRTQRAQRKAILLQKRKLIFTAEAQRTQRKATLLSSKSENYISSWRHRGTVGQGASH
jgi:hypothetical protein